MDFLPMTNIRENEQDKGLVISNVLYLNSKNKPRCTRNGTSFLPGEKGTWQFETRGPIRSGMTPRPASPNSSPCLVSALALRQD